MNPLDHFLAGPRASRAFTLLMDMDAPWGLDVRDGAALTLMAVISGSARVEGTELREGDVALVTGPAPYLVTDSHGSRPSVRIGPGQTCETLDGRDLSTEMRNGVRRWGNAVSGETTLLVGTYERPDDVGGLVLRALPRLAVVARGGQDAGILEALAHESGHSDPAGQIVIDRLLDVLLVRCIRRWTEAEGRQQDTWLTCHDPLIADALRHMHNAPFHPWTVAGLAEQLKMSRASFAARFRSSVGESPIAHLVRWRLTLAGDLLLNPDTTVAAVALEVGYVNPYAFSTAFKRQTGHTPSEFRKRQPRLV